MHNSNDPGHFEWSLLSIKINNKTQGERAEKAKKNEEEDDGDEGEDEEEKGRTRRRGR